MVFHEVSREDRSDEIPLGRPIDNTAIVVLDEHGDLVPVGVAGEACVGGVGVGAGYLRDPVQTGRAFIPNAFPEVPGKMLYRTGDVVHWGEDGLLRFHGRADEQVKLDGVRIELSEIERCLLEHPGVAEAKLVVIGEDRGARRLVACVVGPGLSAANLRDHVEERLPREMVPGEIVFVDAMPLNHNGKLDRIALRQFPEVSRSVSPCAEDEAPKGPTERAVAELFCRYLDRASIGRTTSFIDAGGSSLLAIQILLAVQEQFGIDISAQEFSLEPNVRHIAALIASKDAVPAGPDSESRWAADTWLPDDVISDGSTSAEVETILLTGATGFVGSHVLASLARRARVFCLVRGEDAAQAKARLRGVLDAYRIPVDPERVEVIVGDISRSAFGLSAEAHAALARRIDAVVHCAGEVNFLRDYSHHRAANVLGTLEGLRFAAKSRAAFHHLSTVSALESPDGRQLQSGYDRSKWVSDRLVQAARERGMRTHVYHVGEAMPHVDRGLPNDRSLVNALLQSGVALGIFPFSRARVDYAPVNAIAEAMAKAIVSRTGAAPSCDLTWPYPTTLADMVVALASVGVLLRFASFKTFIRSLGRALPGS